MTIGKSITALVVFCILCPSLLFGDSALLTNGSFETGAFTGWLTIGDTLVVNSSFGITPTDGSHQALISNAPEPLGQVPNPGYSFNSNGTYSGAPSVAVYTSSPGHPSLLDNFLGLPGGSLASFCGFSSLLCDPYQGSAIKQSFAGSAGSILSFNFDYLSNDAGLDFAFVVMDGTVTVLSNASVGCTTYPITGPQHSGSNLSPTGFQSDCGYQSFSTMLTTSGTHYIGIGVLDITDPLNNSAILVDNFQLASVPEPSTWLLLATGLLGIVLTKRRIIRPNAGRQTP